MTRDTNSAEPAHFAHWPAHVPRQIPLMHTTLFDNLQITAQRYPDKLALGFLGSDISFAELLGQVENLCGWLQQHAGVGHGDRVLLMMQNSPQFVIAHYAIMRAGGVVVPVNPMTRGPELPHYIRDAGARVAVCTGDVAPEFTVAQSLLDESSRLNVLLVTRYDDCLDDSVDPEPAPPPQWASWFDAAPRADQLGPWSYRWSDAMQASLTPAPYRGKADDLVVLGYTSGTTGRPKGCMHTHYTIGHNVVAGALWNAASAADVCFSVVPMFHITGMLYAMHTPIYVGASSIILPRWDREVAGRLISRYRITSWTNIPTMIIDLLASPNMADFDLGSLRVIGGGGAAMPAAIAQRLQEQYGLPYQEGYGLTETAAPSHSNPAHRAKRQCLGIPFVGTDSRVIDPATLAEMPRGESGEIVIRGPQVFKGYWNNPQATAEAFVEIDGQTFFRSGDLGRIDEDGYYFITDRLKRMINASGFKVWPAEVETMLFQHPDIQEACVIASRDAYRGETVKACIVLRADSVGKVSTQDIGQWARTQMAAYKVPRIVQFVDELPKSGSGKVMWRLLQEQEDASVAQTPDS